MTNRWNQFIYGLWAPVYDRLVELTPFHTARERAIAALDLKPGERVLLVGAGTGADLPLLPRDVEVAGIDLSEPMLRKTRHKAERLSISADLRCGDAQALPYEESAFDAAILTLILSVVPDPQRCLQETWRVLRPGGRALVFDKFLPSGPTRPPIGRRLLNLLTRLFGTDINRSFERIAEGLDFRTALDQPSLFSGAYRILILQKPLSESGTATAPSDSP